MLTNYKFTHDRVLIKLKEEVPNPNEIYIPLTFLDQTDGGKIISRGSDNKYLAKGVIVNASSTALDILSKDNISLNDEVLLIAASLQPQYIFYPNRDVLTPKHEGYVLVPSSFIEAKIENQTNEF